MLQQFGEHIRGWLAWIIIGLLAVALGAWGLSSYLTGGSQEGDVAATVNGQKIYVTQINNQLQNMVAQQFKGRVLTAQQKIMLKQQILQRLITQAVFMQSLHQAGFMVSEGQVWAMIQGIPQLQENGKFSASRFQMFLENNNLQAPQFIANMQKNVLSQQFRMGLLATEFALPDDINQAYQQIHETRNYRYVTIPASHYASGISVSDKDLIAYYKDHKAEFMVPEKAVVNYIVLSPNVIAKTIKVTPQEAKAYYDQNQSAFSTPASWRLAMITSKNVKDIEAASKQLKAGTSFMTLMKDKKAPWKSQEVTWSAVDLPPQLIQTFSTMPLKTVSKQIATQAGVSLFYILEKTPSSVRPFASVEKNITRRLQQERAQSIYLKKAGQLSDLTWKDSTTLTTAAKALDLSIQTSPALTNQGQKSGVFSNSDVMTAIFSKDVLQEGYNTKPISLNDGSVVVLRVKQHMKASQKPLSELRDQMIKTMKQQIALRRAGVFAYQLQSDLQKGKSISGELHRLGLGWLNKVNVSANDKSIDPLIQQKAFGLSKGATGTAELKNGFALIQVNSIALGNLEKLTEKEREALSTNISGEWAQALMQLYLSGEMRHAKIKYIDKSLALPA